MMAVTTVVTQLLVEQQAELKHAMIVHLISQTTALSAVIRHGMSLALIVLL